MCVHHSLHNICHRFVVCFLLGFADMMFSGLLAGVVCLVFELRLSMRAERRLEEEEEEEEEEGNVGVAKQPDFPGMRMNMPSMPPRGFQGLPGMGMKMPSMLRTGFHDFPGMDMNALSMPPTGFQVTSMNMMNVPSTGMTSRSWCGNNVREGRPLWRLRGPSLSSGECRD